MPMTEHTCAFVFSRLCTHALFFLLTGHTCSFDCFFPDWTHMRVCFLFQTGHICAFAYIQNCLTVYATFLLSYLQHMPILLNCVAFSYMHHLCNLFSFPTLCSCIANTVCLIQTLPYIMYSLSIMLLISAFAMLFLHRTL